ncbi:MAG: helix-turn-helix transcriptional regulator [bacterium]|nr:helix-turn-helix transcriptional regulator [bacterium]
MDEQKIANLIKELRKKNNLTQKEFAEKYGVTYQAVSKWENGINLPDITILNQICKDFNISLDETINNSKKAKINKRAIAIIIYIIVFIIGLIIFLVIKQKSNNNDFNFKTLSTSCPEFKVTGSIAYNEQKTAIYISHIDYCGGDEKVIYKKIQCTLYEEKNNTTIKIGTYNSNEENIKLETFLQNLEFNINNYKQSCKSFNQNNLYLEINATNKDDTIRVYKIPLTLQDNCQN